MNHFSTIIEALCAAPGERLFVTAWVDEDEQETVTFDDFRGRARSQAGMLREHGVVPGDRVVIIMPQSISAMTTFVGAMMMGAVPAILAYPNFKVEAAKYRAGLAGVTANLRAKLVVIDDEFPEEMVGHVSLQDGSRLVRAGDQAHGGTSELPLYPSCPDDIAFIQHSAGTTGLQKGVALTHSAVLTQIRHLAAALQIDGSKDKIYSWLPLYHDMGLIACFMLPLVCHVPVMMQSPLDWVMHPDTMLQIITEQKCTLAWLPNFALQFIPRRVPPTRWSQYDLSSVRALINCSEPVRARSMDEFARAFSSIGLRRSALQSSYAMAENVFAVSQSGIGNGNGPHRIWVDGSRFRNEHVIYPVHPTQAGALCFVSSGRLLPNHEVRIISDAGHLLSNSQVGEILVRSDCLFQGYYNRADLTAEAFEDGFYRTGDLGFLYDDELFVVGRKKDFLIVGGENLYPQDIEEIVALHPAVHDGRVVAMGIFDPELGTEGIVVVAEVERQELLSCSEQIESAVRRAVVAGLGVSVRTIFLKPPPWIVKSTAGKPARSATRDKLLLEHPELNSH